MSQEQIHIADILEQTTLKQDTKWYSDGKGESFCAMGVFYNYFGWDGKNDYPSVEIINKVHDLISEPIRYEITMMNGRGYNFKEIANWLRTR